MRAIAVLVVILLLVRTGAAFEVVPTPLQAVVVHAGFDFPVSLAFGPDGRMFITEKAGTILVLDGGPPQVWATVDARTDGEQGLLGLALHPDFAVTGWLYAYYTDAGNGTNRVIRLTEAGGLGTGMTILVDGIPRATIHNGGVLAFGADGTLFATTGDAANPPSAQDLGALSGKVLRIRDDGTVPPDNPFPSSPVYTYGHRNVFGVAVDPASGRVWITENGPSRHDEVNALVPGGNFGWPEVTGIAGRTEFVDPASVFDIPLPALTQATFLSSDAYGDANRDTLVFGGWNDGVLYRAVLTPDRRGISFVEAVHRFPEGVLDVEVGPDGRLYVVAATRGGGGSVYALDRLPPVGSSQEGHVLPLAIGAVVVAALFAAYLWRRRGLRRERS